MSIEHCTTAYDKEHVMNIKVGFGSTIVIACLLLGVATTARASVPVTGEFTASKACQAYQSMPRKTNPGKIHLEIGRTYPVFELNVPSGTTWFRLRIEGARPQERWVYFQCGDASVNGRDDFGNQEENGDKTPCQTPGLEDSFILALNWQPAFCESYGEKPECKVDDPTAYQAGNFTLHGLWPNKRSCGTHYNFCGRYKQAVSPFCDYAPVPMQAATLQALGRVMPSAAHGSCLQRHEWYKHGICQTRRDADGYFTIAMELLEQFNAGGMAKFMQDNIGGRVTTRTFFDVVDQAFDEGAHRRLQIACRGGKLVDVYIQLPGELPNGASLQTLLREAEPNFRNDCGQSFEVDAIGQ